LIIACPSCETTFEVETGQIGASGRRVRCGVCGHRWHQAPEPGASDADLSETPASEPGQAPAAEAHAVIAPPAERLIPMRDALGPDPSPSRPRLRTVMQRWRRHWFGDRSRRLFRSVMQVLPRAARFMPWWDWGRWIRSI
jgi:predicted Zn finger-like uncharacterized protein